MSRPVTTTLVRLGMALVAAVAISCARADVPAAGGDTGAGPRSDVRAGFDSNPTKRDAGAAAPAASAGALPRIVFLGDSLTAGLGLAQEQAVPALIQQRLRHEGFAYDVVNAGVSGDTSDGGLTRLEWSLAGDVAVLVIELGANDGLRGIAPARTRQNLESIIRTAKTRGISVLLTGMEAPPNYGPAYTNDFRKTFRDVAAQQHVAFMPFFLQDVAGIPGLNQPDGIHPTPEGARIVANNVWRYLQPLLKKTQT